MHRPLVRPRLRPPPRLNNECDRYALHRRVDRFDRFRASALSSGWCCYPAWLNWLTWPGLPRIKASRSGSDLRNVRRLFRLARVLRLSHTNPLLANKRHWRFCCLCWWQQFFLTRLLRYPIALFLNKPRRACYPHPLARDSLGNAFCNLPNSPQRYPIALTRSSRQPHRTVLLDAPMNSARRR